MAAGAVIIDDNGGVLGGPVIIKLREANQYQPMDSLHNPSSGNRIHLLRSRKLTVITAYRDGKKTDSVSTPRSVTIMGSNGVEIVVNVFEGSNFTLIHADPALNKDDKLSYYTPFDSTISTVTVDSRHLSIGTPTAPIELVLDYVDA